jgi:hypothetical protein
VSVAIPLVHTRLAVADDAGRLVLAPLPVPGVDGTDGSVAIEAKAGITAQKAANRPGLLIAPANPTNVTGSIQQRSANGAGRAARATDSLLYNRGVAGAAPENHGVLRLIENNNLGHRFDVVRPAANAFFRLHDLGFGRSPHGFHDGQHLTLHEHAARRQF